MRKNDADTINTLRKSIKACREEITELKEYKHLYEIHPTQEDIQQLKDINSELNTRLYKAKQEIHQLRNKNSKPKDTELQKKIEAKRKQMEKDKKELELMMSQSNSEDSISECCITDSEEED